MRTTDPPTEIEPAAVTWAVGDIHGFADVFERLLDELAAAGFDLDRDHLWSVGDLVHRGPDSLGVLRRAKALTERMGERFVVVLGNHDLHLLAVAAGRRRAATDLQAVLDAPDGGELIDWLRHRPLAHRARVAAQDVLMVHAGLWPSWTADQALAAAARAATQLQGPRGDAILPGRGATEPTDEQVEHLRTLEALTRLRTIDARSMACRHKGPPDTAPTGCRPWFEAEAGRWRDHRVVFGHWAALGRYRGPATSEEPGVEGLDAGCAWGGHLTALCLDDGREISVPSRQR